MPTYRTTVKIEGVADHSERQKIKKGLEKTLTKYLGETPVEITFEGPRTQPAHISIGPISDSVICAVNAHIRKVFADMSMRQPFIQAQFTLEHAPADKLTGPPTGL